MACLLGRWFVFLKGDRRAVWFELTLWRSFAFGFAVTSLFLLPVWSDIFSVRGVFFDSAFISNHHKINASFHLDYLASILVMVALSLVLGAAIAAAARKSPRHAHILVAGMTLGLVLYGLNVIRASSTPLASLAALQGYAAAQPILFAVSATAGIGIVAFALWRFLRHLTALVMLGLPIGLVILINAGGAVITLGDGAVALPAAALAEPHGKTPTSRVVWIIFDETDYRALFEQRPKDLSLANFDRMRARGLDATRAVPPAGTTLRSIPALISGRSVVSTKFTSDGPILLLEKNSAWHPWGDLPSVFAAVRDKGLNVAVFGQEWIPYCRAFHATLTACWEMGTPWPSAGKSVLSHVAAFTGRVAAYIPVVNRYLRPELFDPGLPYLRFLDGVMDALSNPELALIYVHWNLPHTPYIYDRRSKSFIIREAPRYYFDNAALADRMLGDMIQRLEASGLAARTAVIVTSDHHWRRSAKQYDGITDLRVPFILYFPGQPRGRKFSDAFSTIVTKGLVVAILDESVKTPDQAAAFIRTNGGPPDRGRIRIGKP